MKHKYRDPYILLGGNFNQWPAQDSILEFPDMSEVLVGPTRGDRSIDRIFSNIGRSLTAAGTVPPLETEHSTSDHRVGYATFEVRRQEAFERITYSYRACSEEMKEDFGRWIVQQDWHEVLEATGSDGKADALQDILDAAMDTFFPLKTVRRKSTDPPWITKKIKKRIKRCMRRYVKEGRSELWHAVKRVTDEIIKQGKARYMSPKRDQLTAPDANRSFFRLVKAFNTPEKPPNFDVRSLRPGASDSEVASCKVW